MYIHKHLPPHLPSVCLLLQCPATSPHSPSLVFLHHVSPLHTLYVCCTVQVLEIAARMTEATAGGGPTAPRDVRISHSVIPEHLLGPGENEGGDPDGDPSGGNGSGGGRLEGFMGS